MLSNPDVIYRKIKDHNLLILIFTLSFILNINCEICTSTQQTSSRGLALFFDETTSHNAYVRHIEPFDKEDDESDLLLILFSHTEDSGMIVNATHSLAPN